MKYGPLPSFEAFVAAGQHNHGSSYWWVRGGDYNREVIVEAFGGVRSEPMPYQPGGRLYYAEINFRFPGGFPEIIWQGDLDSYPWLKTLEWAGPVLPPSVVPVVPGIKSWLRTACGGGRL